LSGVNGEDLAQKLGRLGDFIQAKELEILNQEENYQKSSQIESELDKLLSDQENLESNIQRKQEIDSLLKSKELRLLESKNDFGLRLRSIAPSVLLAPTLISLGVHIEDAKGKGILPPPIDVNYLRELLENGKCICGSSLTLDSDHRKHLEAQIAEYATVSEVGNALNEHSTTYRVLLDRIPGYKDLIDALNQGIKEKEEEQEELLAENALLAQALEGQDNDYVRELASSRAKAREAAMRANHTLQIARSEVIQATSEKDSVEKQIEKAASANAAAKSAGLKAEFGREVAYYSKKLFETMNTQVREAVASSLHDMFQNMMWKKGYFTNIGIDENFRVSVLNNKNIEVLNRLAAGERLCLAFAFSLTLSKEAGLNFPIIVDTPMGRLAPEVQVNLAEVLTEATKSEDKNKNHQIILLMTETEYNEKVAKVFNKRRPKVLEIHFNPETSETSVS
jgi:DNA sulfur modification protein DndD